MLVPMEAMEEVARRWLGLDSPLAKQLAWFER